MSAEDFNRRFVTDNPPGQSIGQDFSQFGSHFQRDARALLQKLFSFGNNDSIAHANEVLANITPATSKITPVIPEITPTPMDLTGEVPIDVSPDDPGPTSLQNVPDPRTPIQNPPPATTEPPPDLLPPETFQSVYPPSYRGPRTRDPARSSLLDTIFAWVVNGGSFSGFQGQGRSNVGQGSR